jgi:hypothetical protein
MAYRGLTALLVTVSASALVAAQPPRLDGFLDLRVTNSSGANTTGTMFAARAGGNPAPALAAQQPAAVGLRGGVVVQRPPAELARREPRQPQACAPAACLAGCTLFILSASECTCASLTTGRSKRPLPASDRPKRILLWPATPRALVPGSACTHAIMRRMCRLHGERTAYWLPSKARPATHARGLHIRGSCFAHGGPGAACRSSCRSRQASSAP